MKTSNIKAYISLFHLALLVTILSACTEQNKPSQHIKKVQVANEISSSKIKVDTTLRLKFTTGIRSILEDSKGNFWFGSHQEGLCLFDGKELIYFTEADGLSDKQIRSIYEDADGIVWFEGGKGVSNYDGKKIKTYTNKNYSAKNDWQSDGNDLWFKGDEDLSYNEREVLPGVYRYDGKQLNYHIFPTLKKKTKSTYSISTPFAKGKNATVWFGTYAAVIGYHNVAPPIKKATFTIIDDNSLGLNEDTGYLHIRSLFEDSRGRLWIGNNGIGLLLYDGLKTVNFSGLYGLISANSLHSGGYRSPMGSLEHVFSIGEDRDGVMWFGDRDTGAWRYDGKSWNNYTTEDGLTTHHIWQIYKDKKGDLWFAMGDGSVCQFNGKSFDRVF